MIPLVFGLAAAVCAAMAAWNVPGMLHGHPLNAMSFAFCLTLAIYNVGKGIKADG